MKYLVFKGDEIILSTEDKELFDTPLYKCIAEWEKLEAK